MTGDERSGNEAGSKSTHKKKDHDNNMTETIKHASIQHPSGEKDEENELERPRTRVHIKPVEENRDPIKVKLYYVMPVA